MSVRTYPVGLTSDDVEELAQELAGIFGAELIVVEVFDDPDARWSHQHGSTIGPWVVGPADEVHAHLARAGREDYREHGTYAPYELEEEET